jgi:hypothetical protein
MRTLKEQMYKLGLLPLAIPVIKMAKRIIKYDKCEVRGKETEFWHLQERVGKQNVMITITLRKVGTGKIAFFSIEKEKDKGIKYKIKKTIKKTKRWFV